MKDTSNMKVYVQSLQRWRIVKETKKGRKIECKKKTAGNLEAEFLFHSLPSSPSTSAFFSSLFNGENGAQPGFDAEPSGR